MIIIIVENIKLRRVNSANESMERDILQNNSNKLKRKHDRNLL